MPPVRVSVVIPVYNAARHLRACLDSVLCQTLREMEVICIDDGSTDASAMILLEFAAKDPRVKTVSQANAGQGAARNRGLAIASGDFVYCVDADDEIAEGDALERLVNEAERDRLDALFFDAETCVDEGLSVPPSVVRAEDYIRTRDYSGVHAGRALFARFLSNREYTVSPCLVLLRRAFLETGGIRFPEERIFYEDNIFMTRVLLAAARAGHRPWRLYRRKVHAGSTVTSAPTMRHLLGYLACYRDADALLSRGGWDRRTRAVLRERRRVYKLHVRRLAGQVEMDAAARAMLAPVLRYPIGEKVVNAFHCLSERGLAFTLRRILFGRQS